MLFICRPSKTMSWWLRLMWTFDSSAPTSLQSPSAQITGEARPQGCRWVVSVRHTIRRMLASNDYCTAHGSVAMLGPLSIYCIYLQKQHISISFILMGSPHIIILIYIYMYDMYVQTKNRVVGHCSISNHTYGCRGSGDLPVMPQPG